MSYWQDLQILVVWNESNWHFLQKTGYKNDRIHHIWGKLQPPRIF